jgi:5-(carboxyamino)imidazole ribonucleotide synthase
VLAEQFLDLELELSVLVARREDGGMVSYAPAVNHHEAGVLDWSVWPATLPDQVTRDARQVAEDIAAALDIVGLLAVEMFLTTDGRLLVNELAPRPHNSYHHSERAASTSQFEQFVRAVCGLPLGSVDPLQPGAIANLLGDLWKGGEPDVEAALKVPDVRLHLYGKTSARPGRATFPPSEPRPRKPSRRSSRHVTGSTTESTGTSEPQGAQSSLGSDEHGPVTSHNRANRSP